RVVFFFSSRRRHTRFSRDWSSDVCSSDLTSHKFMKGSESPSCPFHRLEENVFRTLVSPALLGGGPLTGTCSLTFGVLHFLLLPRSEERRVGKECSALRSPCG